MDPIEKGLILVVDDDPDVRDVLLDCLENQGYAVLTADGGEEALTLLRERDVEVIVTDLGMPGTDGLALLRCLRDRYPRVATIAMTGQGTVDSASRALAEGAFDWFPKPIRASTLYTAVSRALVVGRLRRENLYLRQRVRLLESRLVEMAITPPASEPQCPSA